MAIERFRMGFKMRIGTAALSLAFIGTFWLSLTGAQAETPSSGMRAASASASLPAAATELSSQRRVRRPPTRLRVYPRYQPDPDGVYPRYYPGRNAVRDCSVTYAQEFRPSGTVITPRMNCYWRPG